MGQGKKQEEDDASCAVDRSFPVVVVSQDPAFCLNLGSEAGREASFLCLWVA
jgi:hypothetical protein